MNKDQVKGRAEELAGKTKKVVGGIVGNENLKDKGHLEAKGKVRATYGDAKNEIEKDQDQDRRQRP
jgi:uncharacterized protein YjbJ (UPF0337 family)